MKRIIGIVLLLALVLGGVILYNAQKAVEQQGEKAVEHQDEELDGEIGMFEWDENALENPQKAEKLKDVLGVTRWYQEIPKRLDTETMGTFAKRLHDKGIEVYSLVGSVEWGYEKDGSSLIKEIKRISKYNQSAGSGEQIDGLMVDVEPYTSSRWEKNKEKNMEVYVSGMIKAYEYAKEENLRVAICIPRHYDDQGLTEQLEQLIEGACDEVAVMDYDCGQEIRKIATEAGFAKKYNKELHCILEFQEVGKHGLTEDKTYRNKGIAEAKKTWNLMKEAYPDQKIICDYHWSKPILEMLEEEEP